MNIQVQIIKINQLHLFHIFNGFLTSYSESPRVRFNRVALLLMNISQVSKSYSSWSFIHSFEELKRQRPNQTLKNSPFTHYFVSKMRLHYNKNKEPQWYWTSRMWHLKMTLHYFISEDFGKYRHATNTLFLFERLTIIWNCTVVSRVNRMIWH